MFPKQFLLNAMLSAGLMVPTIAQAGTFSASDYDSLSLTPAVASPTSQQQQSEATDAVPKYLDVAPAAPQIHGFFDSPFKTAYITPRGLFVENEGLVWQPVVGLIFPTPDFGLKGGSVVAGIWNSVNSNNHDPQVGAWNEMDVFVGYGAQITKQLRFDLDYEAWSFPGSTLNKPKTEHVSQLKFSYDDSSFWGTSGFALHPYVNFFYEWGGSSTVVLGRNGNTGYVEPGIVPTFTIKGSTPITFTFPTYVSIGPKEYWGRGGSPLAKADGNFGVFSTGVNVNVPLSFIPVQYGNWHAEAGLLYYYLINDALLRSGTLLSGNTERSVFNAYVGVGVGF